MASISDLITDCSLREREALEAFLEPGEEVRWATRPFPQFWHAEDAFTELFALCWFGFCFWGGADILSTDTFLPRLTRLENGAVFALLFGLVFWGTGLAIASTPWLRYRRQRNTLYAISNRRALIMEPGFFPQSARQLRGYLLHGNMLRQRLSRPQGRGDLLFTPVQDRNGESREEGFLNLPALEEAQRQLFAAIADFEALRGEHRMDD